MVAIDRWSHMEEPTFLRHIPFWVLIQNLPQVYRRHHIVRSIESMLGQVEEVLIIEPIGTRPVEVWVKVDFDVDNEITLARNIQIMNIGTKWSLSLGMKVCINYVQRVVV